MLRTITGCCTTICPYPTYGHECQGLCRCDKDKCDVSNRREPKTTGKMRSRSIFTGLYSV